MRGIGDIPDWQKRQSQPTVTLPILRAFNEEGTQIREVTTVPLSLEELPVHIQYFKDRTEKLYPAAGKIVRVTVDLAL